MASRILIIAFLMCYSYRSSYAAITPLDETYTATVGDEVFTIPWVYDNEADMNNVEWSYKSQSATTAATIMTKSTTNPAVAAPGYDVEHDIANGNGNIKLKSVTADSAGIYFCTVTYKLSSGLPIATGTATLSVTSAPGPAAPGPGAGLSTGAIVGIVITVVAVIGGGSVGGFLLYKKNSRAKKRKNTEKTEAEPETHAGNPRSNRTSPSVKMEDEHNKHGPMKRPQPPPPGTNIHGRPMPAITPGHDSKGRGLSANFDDKDHPLEYIETPAQRKGALGALDEGTGEESQKVKKKKKKSNKNRDLNVDEE